MDAKMFHMWNHVCNISHCYVKGIVGQVGSAIAGGLLGWVLEKHGWDAYVPILTAAALFSILLILVYTLFHPRQKDLNEHND